MLSSPYSIARAILVIGWKLLVVVAVFGWLVKVNPIVGLTFLVLSLAVTVRSARRALARRRIRRRKGKSPRGDPRPAPRLVPR